MSHNHSRKIPKRFTSVLHFDKRKDELLKVGLQTIHYYYDMMDIHEPFDSSFDTFVFLLYENILETFRNILLFQANNTSSDLEFFERTNLFFHYLASLSTMNEGGKDESKTSFHSDPYLEAVNEYHFAPILALSYHRLFKFIVQDECFLHSLFPCERIYPEIASLFTQGCILKMNEVLNHFLRLEIQKKFESSIPRITNPSLSLIPSTLFLNHNQQTTSSHEVSCSSCLQILESH